MMAFNNKVQKFSFFVWYIRMWIKTSDQVKFSEVDMNNPTIFRSIFMSTKLPIHVLLDRVKFGEVVMAPVEVIHSYYMYCQTGWSLVK